MIRLRRLTATAALLLAAAPHVLVACASAPARPAPDPRTWAMLKCANCERSGITVETRRSVDKEGRAGRYVFARVSNLNQYPVTFLLDLQHEGPHGGDPDFLRRQLRITLPAGGSLPATTLVALEYSDIADASVSAVERM